VRNRKSPKQLTVEHYVGRSIAQPVQKKQNLFIHNRTSVAGGRLARKNQTETGFTAGAIPPIFAA
jgi:hypothetical protein